MRWSLPVHALLPAHPAKDALAAKHHFLHLFSSLPAFLLACFVPTNTAETTKSTPRPRPNPPLLLRRRPPAAAMMKDKMKDLMKKVTSSSAPSFKGPSHVLGSGPAPSTPASSSSSRPSNPNPNPKPPPNQQQPPLVPSSSPARRPDANSSNTTVACPNCGDGFTTEHAVSEHLDGCLAAAGGARARAAAYLAADPPPPAAAVEVAKRLLGNLLREPGNDKFRRVRLANPRIKDAVADRAGGLDLLEAAGFAVGDQGGELFAVMDEAPSDARLGGIRRAVLLLERSHPSAPVQTPVEAASKESARSGVDEQKEVQKIVDRQIRVFFNVPGSSVAETDAPDSFYKLSSEEVSKEARMRRERLEQSRLLIPKSYKEKQALAARQKYKQAVIRIQFPDGVILQGVFLPAEATGSLYEFVASALKQPSLEFDLICPGFPRLIDPDLWRRRPPPVTSTSKPPPGRRRPLLPSPPLSYTDTIADVTPFIPITLDLAQHNYYHWRHLFEVHLGRCNLRHHIAADAAPRPDDARWITDDLAIIQWIYTRVSTEIFNLVFREAATAAALWASLRQLFQDNADARINNLHSAIRNTPQGDSSLSVYYQRIQTMADELRELGDPMPDRQLINILLQGLGDRFKTQAAMIPFMQPRPSFKEIRSLLQNADDDLTRREARPHVFAASTRPPSPTRTGSPTSQPTAAADPVPFPASAAASWLASRPQLQGQESDAPRSPPTAADARARLAAPPAWRPPPAAPTPRQDRAPPTGALLMIPGPAWFRLGPCPAAPSDRRSSAYTGAGRRSSPPPVPLDSSASAPRRTPTTPPRPTTTGMPYMPYQQPQMFQPSPVLMPPAPTAPLHQPTSAPSPSWDQSAFLQAMNNFAAQGNSVAETVWLRQLLAELHRPIQQATIVYCDNISAVYMSSNAVQHRRTKHIEIDIHFVREKVALGQVRVLHVPTTAQFADIFTKGLPTQPFHDIRFSLNVIEPHVDTAGGC
ncbi:hypothetical protein QYE76_016472 [Lolium multiflorum]|uniref:PUB domain-containing protein n=1 Tax=Lolium multiflorum TaxID=4521 RepID=A0AAD8QIE3_LOLMU|nr:hypothetical protein QYE76_016472 [Lolium multiflorum]